MGWLDENFSYRDSFTELGYEIETSETLKSTALEFVGDPLDIGKQWDRRSAIKIALASLCASITWIQYFNQYQTFATLPQCFFEQIVILNRFFFVLLLRQNTL